VPYIEKNRRIAIACGQHAATPGELNYKITREVHDYIRHNGESYATYNAALGALEAAKLELYRRFVAPYEDTKIHQNGDVTI
jgi:hypothetical protein